MEDSTGMLDTALTAEVQERSTTKSLVMYDTNYEINFWGSFYWTL